MILTFVIPGQPQGKGRPRAVKIAGQTRLATPAKTAAYEGLIAMAAQEAMKGGSLMLGPMGVHIDIFCQVPASWSAKKQREALAHRIRPTSKPDSDNVVKAVYDGCNGVVWRDDSQVVEGSQSKYYAEKPFLRVYIEPVVMEATC